MFDNKTLKILLAVFTNIIILATHWNGNSNCCIRNVFITLVILFLTEKLFTFPVYHKISFRISILCCKIHLQDAVFATICEGQYNFTEVVHTSLDHSDTEAAILSRDNNYRASWALLHIQQLSSISSFSNFYAQWKKVMFGDGSFWKTINAVKEKSNKWGRVLHTPFFSPPSSLKILIIPQM